MKYGMYYRSYRIKQEVKEILLKILCINVNINMTKFDYIYKFD